MLAPKFSEKLEFSQSMKLQVWKWKPVDFVDLQPLSLLLLIPLDSISMQFSENLVWFHSWKKTKVNLIKEHTYLNKKYTHKTIDQFFFVIGNNAGSKLILDDDVPHVWTLCNVFGGIFSFSCILATWFLLEFCAESWGQKRQHRFEITNFNNTICYSFFMFKRFTDCYGQKK